MPKPLICSVCHEEVRWGTRGGQLSWWHRDDRPGNTTLDNREGHEPVFGKPSWESDLRILPGSGQTGEEDDRIFEIPPPEVYSIPIDLEDERMPGGASNLIKAVRRTGGEAQATYARGPRVHGSHGNLLGMADNVMVKFSRDGRHAVARWEKASDKWTLDCGYLVYYCDGKIFPETATAAGIRAWMVKWQGPLQEEPDESNN